MDCPARPNNPCFCPCHGIMVEDDLGGERPLYGCDNCNAGQKLKEPINQEDKK